MPIDLPTPYTVPAVEAKTFPNGWLHSLNIQTPKPGEGSLVLVIVPHNADTGETLDSPKDHYTAPLWEVIQNVPSAEKAMGAVLESVPDIIAYIKSK